jgi:hypothetical protein
MMRVRDLVQDAIWIAFSASLAWARSGARHWRRIIAIVTGGIAIVRAVIWVAKAVASAGTVDALLNLIGLGEYVRPFEAAVDSAIATVVAIILTATPNG